MKFSTCFGALSGKNLTSISPSLVLMTARGPLSAGVWVGDLSAAHAPPLCAAMIMAHVTTATVAFVMLTIFPPSHHLRYRPFRRLKSPRCGVMDDRPMERPIH